MKKKVLLILILGLFMCTLFGCNKENNNSNWYYVKDGEICVALKANYTTGYEWFYTIEDESIVSFVNTTYEVEALKEGMVGVGGTYYASFKPLKDGTTQISFMYKRSWEDCYAQQKFLIINIQNGVVSLNELSVNQD